MIAHILIADDNAEILSFLEEYLTGQHHHVVVANDGFQLSRKAAEHRPHLIIADIQMPGAYGSSVYQVLQKDPNTKDIPVLFISGHPYQKIKHILPNDPKTRFVPKPISFADLDRCIKELLTLGGYVP